MKNENKTLLLFCFFSFLFGMVCAGSIAIGINFYRSGLHRAEVAGLNEQIREYGEATLRYSTEIADQRRRIVELRTETAAGLEECQDIRDAVSRIRKQVEVLAKYYDNTGYCFGSGNGGDDIFNSEIGE